MKKDICFTKDSSAQDFIEKRKEIEKSNKKIKLIDDIFGFLVLVILLPGCVLFFKNMLGFIPVILIIAPLIALAIEQPIIKLFDKKIDSERRKYVHQVIRRFQMKLLFEKKEV
jgi:hypothetical protein